MPRPPENSQTGNESRSHHRVFKGVSTAVQRAPATKEAEEYRKDRRPASGSGS